MSDVDLLLINPGPGTQAYQALASELTAIEPPIWVGLLATFARRRGYSVAVLDANAEHLGPDAVARTVHDRRPTLAAVVVYGHHPSASTQVMPAAGAIVSAIADLDPTQATLLVGGHVAALPERTLTDERATFVCSAEGPHTLVALLDALTSANPRLDAVPDLWYRNVDGTAVRSQVNAPLVSDLDQEMPGVAWDLLPMTRYRAHNWHTFGRTAPRSAYAALYTSLGCPYHCAFCCIQAPFKSAERASGLGSEVNSYRRWSREAIARELETLVHHCGVRHLKLADELFVLNPRHVRDVCEVITERGYDLNIWAYARVDTMTEEMLVPLRAAGVRWLVLGIESGDARVRDGVDKSCTASDIDEAVRRLRAAGLHVHANYIFGLPDDDHRSMQATLDLARRLQTEFANFYCAMAYPGSALYPRALAEGWPLPSSWSGYAQHAVDTHPLPTRHLSATDVLRFRDAAFSSYYTAPEYLSMMEQRFGPDVRRAIEAMTRVPLKRALLGTAS